MKITMILIVTRVVHIMWGYVQLPCKGLQLPECSYDLPSVTIQANERMDAIEVAYSESSARGPNQHAHAQSDLLNRTDT
jgi:hypothetical protein